MANIVGRVIWITGLSGSGKTSLAYEVMNLLGQKKKYPAIHLDGDELRKVFIGNKTEAQNYSRESRLTLSMQYARLCKLISSSGTTVVISTISMFKEVYSWNRKNLPGYFEVYLDVPKGELARRDPKNIYKEFNEGIRKNVAGLDLAVDEPQFPDWSPKFDNNKSVAVLAEELISILEN
ncbi:MAG: adenylyl-sulfate kinase [Pseudomonadota bacterium]|nr:adenylyl-sulfate kinase [Pseudomonadota bacterium]